MKVKCNNKVFDVPDYFSVVNGHLYNNNSQRYEAIDGDYVMVRGSKYTVKDYTDYQIIPVYEKGQPIVLSIEELPYKQISFNTNNIVEYL